MRTVSICKIRQILKLITCMHIHVMHIRHFLYEKGCFKALTLSALSRCVCVCILHVSNMRVMLNRRPAGQFWPEDVEKEVRQESHIAPGPPAGCVDQL